jgi:hypothetical protein
MLRIQKPARQQSAGRHPHGRSGAEGQKRDEFDDE